MYYSLLAVNEILIFLTFKAPTNTMYLCRYTVLFLLAENRNKLDTVLSCSNGRFVVPIGLTRVSAVSTNAPNKWLHKKDIALAWMIYVGIGTS